jgi:hypothetical protein
MGKMKELTAEEVYWRLCQFGARPRVIEPTYKVEVDYRLAFFLAVLSASCVVFMLGRLLASTALQEVLPKVVKQKSKREMEDELFQKLSTLSAYLNILKVELEYLNKQNLDKIALLDRIIAICYGTDSEVKFFNSPLSIKQLFKELKASHEEMVRYQEDNSMVRLDITLLNNNIIKQDMEVVFQLMQSFSLYITKNEQVSKEICSLDEMVLGILDTLVVEKSSFEENFRVRMSAGLRGLQL